MPDLANRGQYEQIAAALLARLLAEQQQQLDGYLQRMADPPAGFWDDAHRKFTAALYLTLLPVFQHAATTVSGDPLAHFAPSKEWVAAKAAAESQQALATTQAKFQDALSTERAEAAALALLPKPAFTGGSTVLPLSSPRFGGDGTILITRRPLYTGPLAGLFGSARAESIAVSTMTDTHTAGQFAGARTIIRRSGAVLVAIWRCEPSACDICQDLDGKPQSEWGEYSAGPKAHPHCRCWVDFVEAATLGAI